MKILFYNWVDYLDAENRGGGVSVYLKNLMTHLGAKEDIEVRFLSSGISYHRLSPHMVTDVELDETDDKYGKQYSISMQMAPQWEVLNQHSLRGSTDCTMCPLVPSPKLQ